MDQGNRSLYIDSRDFNVFADRVKDIISEKTTIVYTDLACHIIITIVLALDDRNIIIVWW